MDTERLRERLDDVFVKALQGDPVCNGRVCTGTIDYLVNEAIKACEAVERKYNGI